MIEGGEAIFENTKTLREKAEELFLKKGTETDSQLSESEMKRLVFELEVHRIELELQNEELLREKEKTVIACRKYSDLFDFAPTGYFTLSKEGKIVELNIYGANLLRNDRLYLTKRQFSFFVSDETRSVYDVFLSKVFRSKTKETCEVTLLSNGDKPVYVHITGIVTENSDQCLLTVTDITDRKRAEDRLQQNNSRLEFALQAANMAWWEMDIPTGNITFDKKKVEMLGYLPEKFSHYKDFMDLVHPDDREKAMNSMRGHFAGVLDKYDVEYRILNKSGDYIYFNDIGAIVKRDLDGKPLKITGLVLNITQRKQSEEAQKESELRYRKLFKNSPSGIMVLDENGIILDANDVNTKTTLYPLSELIGSDVRIMLPPEKAYMVSENINRILTGEVIEEEVVNIRKDGTLGVFLLKEVAITLPDGRLGILSVSNDITARKQSDSEIKLKNEELHKLNIQKDKFFSIIAHDLRSPFQTLVGFSPMAEEKLLSLPLEKIQKIAVNMRRSANKLFNLVENLLEWSLMQQGVIKYEPRSFLLSVTIGEIISLVQDTANRKMIEICLDVPEDLVVIADAKMLESIIHNLVFNALKFTHRGGNIIVSAKSVSDKLVVISVSDTGIGMNMKIIDHLYQLDANISRRGTEGESGTGLGLIICRDFIERHGGKLWVESEEGRGSTFCFSLPLLNPQGF